MPSSEVGVPSSEVEVPSSEVEVPSSKVEVPSSKVEVPSSKVEVPSSEGENWSSEPNRTKRMFEKSYCQYQNVLDPPKSTPRASSRETRPTQWLPLKKGDFDSGSPFFKWSQRGLLPSLRDAPRRR